jgi:hypothetical protein
MTRQEFHQRLLALLRSEPFVPFEVEIEGGETFLVDRADSVATDGGAAGYIDEEGLIHFFDWKNLRRLGSQRTESVSA